MEDPRKCVAGGGDYNSTLTRLITKILVYSRQGKDGGDKEANAVKFSKYLNQLRTHCLTPHSEAAASSSSSARDAVEVKLRKKGALQAILAVVRNVVQSYGKPEKKSQNPKADGDGSQNDDSEEDIRKNLTRESILSNSLSLLANSFAIDHVAIEEAFNDSIVLTLNKILKLHKIISQDVRAKALKCLGNLATNRLCCVQMRISGAVINILNAIHFARENFSEKPSLSTTFKTVVPKSAHKSHHLQRNTSLEKVLHNTVRTLRILCTDLEAKNLLWRINALLVVGEILVWFEDEIDKSRGSNLQLEILKTLYILSVKFRVSPAETAYEFRTQGEPVLAKLVYILENCQDTKILSQAMLCLTNLAGYKEIVPKLNNLLVYDVLFTRLGKETDVGILDRLVNLLRGLVMDDSVVCLFLLPYSSHIFTTIKVFRLPALEKYHMFILSLYKHLLGPALELLIEHGLVELLDELLENIYQSCSFEKLRKRISSLDETACPLHNSNGCPYAPVYRCTSPTYLEIQEEVKEYMIFRSSFDQENSIRKSQSSPAHSWSSSGFVSDNSEVFSASSSGHSSSGSLSGSGDEEAPEADVLYSEHRAAFSDVEMEEPAEPSPDSLLEISHKRRKLDNFNSNSFESESVQHNQASTEKMVVIIDILKNITFLKPFRTNLLKFTPTLMNILCDGKLNCMRYNAQNNPVVRSDISLILNRQLFYGSHRMLEEFFRDINNFAYVLQTNLVPLLHGLIIFGNDEKSKNEELHKCNGFLKGLKLVLAGETNQTIGWREGFLSQNLISPTTVELKEKVAIAIPLLYQVDCYNFRSYQLNYGAWTTLFSMLEKSDHQNFTLFQDCIVSISALCKTLGLKWTETISFAAKPQLSAQSSISKNKNCFEENVITNNSVVFQLDDGSEICTSKELLTNTSPVFSAMFSGNFVEANEKKVKLPFTSKKALNLLLEEIQSGVGPTASSSTGQGRKLNPIEIKILFELLNISNQYLLGPIENKIVNTIVSSCLCPYSAQEIYENIVKNLYNKMDSNVACLDSTEMAHLVLKYLLVGENIGANLQCNVFKRVFDTIEPSVVISDLKSFFESFSTNVLSRPPPLRRDSALISHCKRLNLKVM